MSLFYLSVHQRLACLPYGFFEYLYVSSCFLFLFVFFINLYYFIAMLIQFLRKILLQEMLFFTAEPLNTAVAAWWTADQIEVKLDLKIPWNKIFSTSFAHEIAGFKLRNIYQRCKMLLYITYYYNMIDSIWKLLYLYMIAIF